jgi:hypothetical protein
MICTQCIYCRLCQAERVPYRVECDIPRRFVLFLWRTVKRRMMREELTV